MKRVQLMLGGALVLQVALILIVRSPFASASTASEPQALLPVLDAISAARLELDGAQDESIVLARGGDGWSIQNLDGFPADGTKVEQLLEELSALRVRRPIVRSSRYHEAFKVSEEDREARVRIWDESGDDPDVDLYVGSSPNYRTIHVRRGGDDEVYEVQGLAAYDLRATESTWIRKELVDAPPEQVDRLVLTNVRGRLELAKRDGVWKVVAPEAAASEPLDTAKIESLVTSVTSLRLADAAGRLDAATQGFAEPAATLELGWTAPAGEEALPSTGEATLEIGSAVADNASQRYVTRKGFDYTGIVWENSIKRLLDDDLGALAPSKGDEGS